MSSDNYNVPTWDEWSSSLSLIPCTLILLIIVIVHFYKSIQDFCTQDRKSVQHRRNLPKITKLYQLTSILTCIVVLGYFVAVIFTLLLKNTSQNEEYCRIFLLPILYSVTIAKAALYILFIARLHQVYGDSINGYKLRNLIIFGCVVIIVIVLTMIAQAIVVSDAVVFEDYDDYPHFCAFRIAKPLLIFMAMTDFVFGIGCLIAFLLPLRKTLKGVQSQKVNRKMIYVGTKYTIVVVVAVISTVLFLLIIVAAKVTALAGIDYTINSICVILMTSYYDEMYFKTLCFCCIFCCDKGHKSLKRPDEDFDTKTEIALHEPSKTEKIHTKDASTTTTTSYDTMDQIEAAQPLKTNTAEQVEVMINDEND